ncbi:MAG: citramalate synthase [Limnothrix sp. CACIAM 69d]|nr:MAG: citramalate synthase [Limnothrix sp. CACIAM 69d]
MVFSAPTPDAAPSNGPAQPSSHPASPQLWLYDTTLRDGAQSEGLSFSIEDKLRIARKLDRLRIPFIEGGWPGANPKDVQFFWQLQEEPLEFSEVVAFCSTRRPGMSAEEDPLLKPILAAGTRWVALFGKSWDLHVTEGLKTTLDENIAMIRDSIAFLISQGRQVIYDAEHWFDGYLANPDYAIATLKAAHEAGAAWLALCDTNGGTLPHEVARIVAEVREWLPAAPLGIHTHNDSGTAVANAIAAVQGGARMVQGTINGYGERCGNANLCTLIPNLQLKLGLNCIPAAQLAELTATSRFVSEVANLAPDDRAPYVGLSAFAHKGGIHVSAVERNPQTYEHISPDRVGNQRRIVISDQSGLSNVLAKARSFGLDLDKQDPACRQILQTLKTLENQGYQFEAAEASFDLLMRTALGQRSSFFVLKDCRVHYDFGEPSDRESLATVKVTVGDRTLLEVAEGNGPVAAMDAALRRALVQFYPVVAQFHLTDYKVRILDGGAGTSAKTRVLVESSDGQQRWTTVGVSGNILEASYQAVVEAIEYGLILHGIQTLQPLPLPLEV